MFLKGFDGFDALRGLMLLMVEALSVDDIGVSPPKGDGIVLIDAFEAG